MSPDPSAAVSSVVGTAALCAVAVTLAGVAGLAGARFAASVAHPAMAVDSGGFADFTDGRFLMAATGPEAIPLTGGRLTATVDGVVHEWPLEALAPQLGRTDAWTPGAAVCVVGAPPCLVPEGNEVAVAVFAGDSRVFGLPPVEYRPSFVIESDGGIRLRCASPVSARVLGSEYQDGVDGESIPVSADVTGDDGASWQALGSNPVLPGQVRDLGTLPQDAVLGVRGTWYQDDGSTGGATSFEASRNAIVLRDGDVAPDYAPFADQRSLVSFLLPYVSHGRMTLGAGEAIVLFEFASMAPPEEPAYATTDFNDLVVLFRLADAVCEVAP